MFICSVLQFKFKTARYKFTKIFCPIKSKEGGQGVDMLVDFYRVDDNMLVKKNNLHCYVDIDSYIEHVKVTRDSLSQKYKIVG